MKPSYVYNAKITNVVDGDTIDAEVDVGFMMTAKIRFRLYGLDTMETNDKDPAKKELGLKAKQLLTQLLTGKQAVLHTYKTDKYGRWLAEIYLDDESVNVRLLSEGLAIPYFGGTKEK